MWDGPGFTGTKDTPRGKGSNNCINFAIRSAANQNPHTADALGPVLRVFAGPDCQGEVVAVLRPGEAHDLTGQSAQGAIS